MKFFEVTHIIHLMQMFIFIVSKVLNQVAVKVAIYIKMINEENISLGKLNDK